MLLIQFEKNYVINYIREQLCSYSYLQTIVFLIVFENTDFFIQFADKDVRIPISEQKYL